MPLVFCFSNKYFVWFMSEFSVQNIYKLNFLTIYGQRCYQNVNKKWNTTEELRLCKWHFGLYTYWACVLRSTSYFKSILHSSSSSELCEQSGGRGSSRIATETDLCFQHFTKLKFSGIEWKKWEKMAKQRNAFFIHMRSLRQTLLHIHNAQLNATYGRFFEEKGKYDDYNHNHTTNFTQSSQCPQCLLRSEFFLCVVPHV